MQPARGGTTRRRPVCSGQPARCATQDRGPGGRAVRPPRRIAFHRGGRSQAQVDPGQVHTVNWEAAAPPRSIPPWQISSAWATTAPLVVPDEPIIPFIEGDGTGVDIWPAAKLVLDAAAAKHGHKVAWKEVLAGQKAFDETGNWLPDETVDTFREHLIGIKGPLTTPVGGGIRSLNVALRQILDLYVCLRPVRWFAGVPSPVRAPRAGRHGHLPGEHRGRLRRLRGAVGHARGREARRRTCATRWAGPSGSCSGIGIKPISPMGSKRLIRAAIEYALDRKRRVRDAGAQGQHPEVHRGRLPRVGLRARPRGVRRRGRRLGRLRRQPGRQAARQGHHRRHHAAAGADPAVGLRRHRHDQPQRRLPLRRPGRPGRRHRHRPGGQHQLRDRPRHLRGDARHGAEVRRAGQGEPRLGAALGRADVRAHRLEQRGRPTSCTRSRPPSPTRS